MDGMQGVDAEGLPRDAVAPCQNRALPRITHESSPMDVEHINAIGNSLADLTKRTVDLRGYL